LLPDELHSSWRNAFHATNVAAHQVHQRRVTV
jgi:hypothetical protein